MSQCISLSAIGTTSANNLLIALSRATLGALRNEEWIDSTLMLAGPSYPGSAGSGGAVSLRTSASGMFHASDQNDTACRLVRMSTSAFRNGWLVLARANMMASSAVRPAPPLPSRIAADAPYANPFGWRCSPSMDGCQP